MESRPSKRYVSANLFAIVLVLLTAGMVKGQSSTGNAAVRMDLPTSKQLGSVPGSPQQINSLPMTLAISPDKRYVVTVNAGYGTFESGYDQSLTVLDTRTGKIEDFPDERTLVGAAQTLYSGLAFAGDGKHLYGTIDSTSAPEGGEATRPGAGVQTGNGVVVYAFADGKLTRERMIKIGLQPLAPGHSTNLGGRDRDATYTSEKGIPFPAALAVVKSASGEHLLVADNLSDDVLLIDPATGATVTRFDLAENDAVPSTYPIALTVASDQKRAYVALWNASEIVELDLVKGTLARKLALLKPDSPVVPGTHPCAFELTPDGRTLYVALANRDAVAAVNVGDGAFAVKGYFDTRLPRQTYFGAEPEALALNADGSRLYVANSASDAVAVIDTRKLTPAAQKRGMIEPIGFIPTEWMPMSLGFADGKLYVATAKGRGTGSNNFAQKQTAESGKNPRLRRDFTYIATLLHGSLATIDVAKVERDLPSMTTEVLEANRMQATAEKMVFAPAVAARMKAGEASPIKHVIYLIKENRTYDQVFGDLKAEGKPVGNGDASLTMYGEEITPNQHKLALQFGVLDNFYDSAEVSADGHIWSNAAIGSDYLEKTWEQNYRSGQRTYDFEGVVANGVPLLQKIPDVAEPKSGYLWTNAEAHGKTHYNFGEYISSTFCNQKAQADPTQGPVLAGSACTKPEIKPGEAIPENLGGGKNDWPWAIPMLAKNVPTKPELVGHFAVEAPDFNLRVPDQLRAQVFMKHLEGWKADLADGNDTMPNLIVMRLGNDHTAGTQPGGPTPKASVADNDLAVGRIVEAVSKSAYWDSTALFILEDDAQNGADHVDAHRSIALVVSKYAPHGPAAGTNGPVVDSRFYTTVSVVRTMETLIGLPPMNNNDAFSSMISTLFTGPGDQPAFTTDTSNKANGLIYAANKASAPGAKESMKMDFRHEDRVDPRALNVILWQDAMGDKPVPAALTVKAKAGKRDED